MSARDNKSVVSNVAWSFAEKISSQLVSFIVSIVLARILLPDDFGLISMILVFITLAEVFVNSGFSSALIQDKNADEVDFSTIFYLSFAASIAIYLLIFFASYLIADFYGREELTPLLQVFALKIPLSSFNSIQRAYVSRHLMFRKFFFSTSIGTLLSGAIGIAMAFNGYGAWSLIAQNVSLTIIDSVVLLFIVPWRPRLVFSFQRGKQLMSYGWKILAADFSGTFFGQLRSLVIGKAYTSADLAFYDRGNQIPQIVANNIGNAVSSVLFPVMSNHSDDSQEVKSMCRRSMKTMSYIISPLMFGIAACAPALITLLYTDKWSDCIPFIQILAIGYAFGTVGLVPIQALKAIGKSGTVLKLEFIKKPVFVLLLIIGVSHSVWAVALSMLIYELFGFAVNATQLKRFLDYSFKEQVIDVVPHIILASVMGFAVSLIQLDAPLVLTLLVQVVVGVLVYIAGSLVLRLESFRYLMQMVRRGA